MGAATSELTWEEGVVWTATAGVDGGDEQHFPDALAAMNHLFLGAPLSRETLWYLQVFDSDIFWSEMVDEVVLCRRLSFLVLHDCSSAVAGEISAALANGNFRRLQTFILNFETADSFGISIAETNALLDMFPGWQALVEWTGLDGWEGETVCAKIRFDRAPRKKRERGA